MLTKAKIQRVPIFMFSALPAPKGVMQQCRNIQRDFLWGEGEEKKNGLQSPGKRSVNLRHLEVWDLMTLKYLTKFWAKNYGGDG